MEDRIILGQSLEQWEEQFPLLKELIVYKKVFWINPKLQNMGEIQLQLDESHIKDAEDRLHRFSNLICKIFPETKSSKGIIESPLKEITMSKIQIEKYFSCNIEGRLFLKCDNKLPIAGSIKARGGIYEVLKHAEDLAIKNGLLSIDDDYSIMAEEKFKEFFNRYSIVVGSTGNLGLSIGIISAKLGFKVQVHMSSDAKQWKKDLLRSKGVDVIEYISDYSKAVEEGRKQSLMNPMSYFIDDENSQDLFLGYSVAAKRLKNQLLKQGLIIDENHPLFVYLPCGVGGAPGGVAFGLKLIFGDNVHCFFAEPTHSPCMLIGLMTGKNNKISVQDFEIDNITEADGLAVGTPSKFVGTTIKNLLSGVYTVTDDELYALLSILVDYEKIHIEPSAAAGLVGPIELKKNADSICYLKKHNLLHKLDRAYHICWLTGGNLVPKDIMKKDYVKGLKILENF